MGWGGWSSLSRAGSGDGVSFGGSGRGGLAVVRVGWGNAINRLIWASARCVCGLVPGGGGRGGWCWGGTAGVGGGRGGCCAGSVICLFKFTIFDVVF